MTQYHVTFKAKYLFSLHMLAITRAVYELQKAACKENDIISVDDGVATLPNMDMCVIAALLKFIRPKEGVVGNFMNMENFELTEEARESSSQYGNSRAAITITVEDGKCVSADITFVEE